MNVSVGELLSFIENDLSIAKGGACELLLTNGTKIIGVAKALPNQKVVYVTQPGNWGAVVAIEHIVAVRPATPH